MKTIHIEKLSGLYFRKVAQSAVYSVIRSLHQQGQNLIKLINQSKKTGSWDPAVDGKAKTLVGLISRLLYNASNYGLTESTAARYGSDITSAVADLNSYVSKNKSENQNSIYNTIKPILSDISSTMNNYVPVSMPAMSGKQVKEPAQNSSWPNVSDTASKFEMELAQADQDRKDQEMGLHPGGTIGYGKVPETIPGPGGGRVPSVPESGVGAAKPKPFEFPPAGMPGPAHLAPEVDLSTDEEKNRKLWEI